MLKNGFSSLFSSRDRKGDLLTYVLGGEGVIFFFIRIILPSFIYASAEDLLLQVMLRSMQCVEVTLGTEQQQRGSESMG